METLSVIALFVRWSGFLLLHRMHLLHELSQYVSIYPGAWYIFTSNGVDSYFFQCAYSTNYHNMSRLILVHGIFLHPLYESSPSHRIPS